MKTSSVSTLAITIASIGLIGFSAAAHPIPIVIWNASASMPIGLYRVIPNVPKLGDLVLIRAPKSVAPLADIRGYLPAGVPLVKRIAATSGDVVCSSNLSVFINGKMVVRQLKADGAGRILPLWKGCRKLVRDEYFLLGNAPDSFDSRYFGPVITDRVIGRIVPLWTE